MKKLSFILCVLLAVCTFCMSAFAVTTADDAILWDDPISYGTSAGYVRFAERSDGTLLMIYAGNGYMRFSTDKGQTWTKSSEKVLKEVAPDATSFTYDYDGTTHTINPENLQPYVVSDDLILVAYRARSTPASYEATGKFYTSIRVVSSTDGGYTFGNEQILIEDCTEWYMDGFWEPFMIHLDDDTVALYYADDLNVDNNTYEEFVLSSLSYVTYEDDSRQRIDYFLYERDANGTWTWTTTPATAIYRGATLQTRDGMPVVSKLKDGGFAMVVEAQDYASHVSDYNTEFVVGLALSEDGETWSDPVPVIAPTDLTAGHRCSAPAIATLPDGRVVITWQSPEGRVGTYGEVDTSCILGAAISKAPLTKDTVLAKTTGGASADFRILEGVFTYPENAYQIWNIVSCFGNDLYIAGGKGEVAEDGTTSNKSIFLRHATVFASSEEAATYHAANARATDDIFTVKTLTPVNGTATFVLPAAYTGDCIAYRMKNGFLNKMSASVADGKISFAAEETETYVFTDKELVSYGDVNGDGKITLRDTLGALRLMVSTAAEMDLFAAEVSGDAKLDLVDALQILMEALN